MFELVVIVGLIANNIAWFMAFMKMEKAWYKGMNDVNETWFRFFNDEIKREQDDARKRIIVLEEKVKEIENGKETAKAWNRRVTNER